jgi:hypothetical protein
VRVGADEEPLPFTRDQRGKSGMGDDVWRQVRSDCRFFARRVMHVEGDKWQDLFWGALSGPHIDPTAKKLLALLACKGPGKTFGEAVGGWWWLFTRWHARGVAMSITGDNLKDNLWTEFAQLQQQAPALSHFFSHRGERIECKEYPKDWWLSARSFPQNADKNQQANTLAGLHGRHPIVICDEAGGYPDGVVVAAEAVLASLVDGKPPDGRIILGGNPDSTDGPLFRVSKKDKARWWVYKITSDPRDPNRSPRVDPAWVADQISAWGYDSDFVKVNILGEFPSQQANKLIGPDLLIEASSKQPDPSFRYEPLIFGIDVARYGDASSVLMKRQGNMTWRPRVWREVDHMTLADQIAYEYEELRPDAIFVDKGPIGVGLIDRLNQLGVPCLPIDFGGSPMDEKFFDRRSEMYWKMSLWFKSGGTIPDDASLRNEVAAPTYMWKPTAKVTKLKLESKEEMRKRGIKSPDIADALALTFAAPVVGRRRDRDAERFGARDRVVIHEQRGLGYAQGKIIGGTEDSWDPFAGGG